MINKKKINKLLMMENIIMKFLKRLIEYFLIIKIKIIYQNDKD